MDRKPQNRYINALTDFGFKKIFGDKEIMIAFLTDLLLPKTPIEDVIFLDKELGGVSEYDRGVVYDLLCKTIDGNEFIVEMQNRSQIHFSDWIIFYLSRSFSDQEEKGNSDWDFQLKPVYGIFFLNFHLRGFKPLTLRTVQLKVDETGELFTDKLKVFTLELPDYRKMREEDCKSKIDYWLYNITNLETMTTNVPFQSEQPIFSKVGNIAELVHMTAEERQKYNVSIDSYRTNLSVMKNERMEGRAEALRTAALNLKHNGVPVDVIAKSLGLTEEEIEQL
ncbi:MAG: Rpn family recombination-promoting nuclease/putative transposase [Prevotellaceae bacterium]|nr:Rpn family recombination-promoting nuclease/putative transposase [Prevotellaceae bacterium]